MNKFILNACILALFSFTVEYFAPISALAQTQKPLPQLFQKFVRANDNFVLTKDSRIVLVELDADLLKKPDALRGWAEKLRYATGLPLPIVMDSGVSITPSDIVLELATANELSGQIQRETINTHPGYTDNFQKDIQSNLAREGYLLGSSSKGLTIRYEEPMGALRGLQTLTLLVMNDGKGAGKHDTVAGVNGLDFPLFENRRIMLDVARYFIPVDQSIGYMDKMSMYKLNELQLHLNDSANDGTVFSLTEGFFPTRGYFRLYNDDKPRFNLVPPDGKVYTKRDWERLEAAAYRYGIKIIPEFDTPGHSKAFARDNSALEIVGDTIITKNPDPAVAYFSPLIKEFRPWFKTDTIHIGGDEAAGNEHADTVKYINALHKSLAKTTSNPDGFEHVWIWYEVLLDPWTKVEQQSIKDIDPKIGIVYWQTRTSFGATSSNLSGVKPRAKWLDAEAASFYFVPKNPTYSTTGVSPQEHYAAYSSRLKKYQEYKTIPDGIQLSEWNDLAKPLNIGVDYINAGMSESFAGLGLITWHGLVYDKYNNVVPYEQTAYDQLIAVSQEMSSFWVRDRFPYFDGQQAMDVLLDTARHREILKSWIPLINLLGITDYLSERGPTDTDWMGWDTEDLALAFRGPVYLRKGQIFVVDLPGEGKPMQANARLICRDVGYALKERDKSVCDEDIWANAFGGEGNLKKTGVGRLQLSIAPSFKGRVELDNGSLIVPRNSELATNNSKIVRNGGLLGVD